MGLAARTGDWRENGPHPRRAAGVAEGRPTGRLESRAEWNETKNYKTIQFTVKPKLFRRFGLRFQSQVVAEDGVHLCDLIRVKVVCDLEDAFAEGVDDRG